MVTEEAKMETGGRILKDKHFSLAVLRRIVSLL